MSQPGKKQPREKEDRIPTDAELLHELRKHGAPPPPREIPAISRRTRDFLITAGFGSLVIGFATFRILGNTEITTFRLAFTGIALFCGLLWYIFYGVMSRY